MLLSSDDGYGSTVIHRDYPTPNPLPWICPDPPKAKCCPCAIDPPRYSLDSPSPTLLQVSPVSLAGHAAIRVIFRLIMYYSEEEHSLFMRID